MKKFIAVLLCVFAGASSAVFAQSKEIVYIKSVRFATPLLEKWIAEYAEINPDLKIEIADKNVLPEKADIQLLISAGSENESQTNRFSFAIGRYALLPIAGKNNVLLKDLKKKKLNVKRLKELFFEKDLLEDEDVSEKDPYNATVYSVNNPFSVSGSFADHFRRTLSDLKGKKITGDDIYLISAIEKDNTGVSFNNLNYIYDIESRRLKENIAILPLDLKKEDNEIIEASDLDKVIDLLERKSIQIIPVDELFFVLHNHENPKIQSFLQWILSEGQRFNHQFGLLKLDQKTVDQQLTALVF